MNNILNIKNLNLKFEEKTIFNNFSMKIHEKGIYTIMGPNGTGKTTLSKVISGEQEINNGEVLYNEENIFTLTQEERFHKGIFVSNQHPTEFDGLQNKQFLQLMYNEYLKANNKPELNSAEFLKVVLNKLSLANIPKSFLKRDLNFGMSGGEKKKNEILQMLLVEPKLVILDEIDSGLDVDAMNDVVNGIKYLTEECNTTFLIITHYKRILEKLNIKKVFIFNDGEIKKEGGKEIIENIEKNGYKGV